MKHSLLNALAISAIATSMLLVSACGDDSSSNASGGISRKASLYVDESQQLLVMTLDKLTEDMCVVEGDNLTWKSMDIYVKPDSLHYEFHGDTLLLFSIYQGKPENYAQMLTGGSAGNIYGTWTYIACSFEADENVTQCSANNKKYYHRTITFSHGSVEADYEFHFDLYLADHDDYMNSYFMAQLFQILEGRSSDLYLDEVMYMDSAEVQKHAEDDGIVFKEKTKTNATFELGGKTYTVSAKVDRSLQESGYYTGNDNNEIHVEVSDGATVCKADYVTHYVNSSYCKAEYWDDLYFDDDWEDINHNNFTTAERYRYSNSVTFKECIQGIGMKFDPMDGYNFPSPIDGLAKKAVQAETDSAEPRHETREEKFFRKLMKYAK